MSVNIDRAKKLMDYCLQILVKKNEDYGSQNIARTGIPGISTRLLDKVSRLANLTKGGKTPNFEGVSDTFVDVLNYALIGLLLAEGSWEGVEDLEERPVNGGSPMVYLAGSIDTVGRDVAGGWRDEATESLVKLGFSVFNPLSPYVFGSNARMPKSAMQQINRTAIRCSRFVLVKYDSHSFGTVREVEFAKNLKIPVVIFGEVSDLHRRAEASDLIVQDCLDNAIEQLVALLLND